jgi:hypothetical protein
MTRKDYVLIAKAINDAYQPTHELNRVWVRVTASHIALALAKDNVRFDTDKFMKACTKS